MKSKDSIVDKVCINNTSGSNFQWLSIDRHGHNFLNIVLLKPSGRFSSNSLSCAVPIWTDSARATLPVTIITSSSGWLVGSMGSMQDWSLCRMFRLYWASDFICVGLSSLWIITFFSVYPLSISATSWTSRLHVAYWVPTVLKQMVAA